MHWARKTQHMPARSYCSLGEGAAARRHCALAHGVSRAWRTPAAAHPQLDKDAGSQAAESRRASQGIRASTAANAAVGQENNEDHHPDDRRTARARHGCPMRRSQPGRAAGAVATASCSGLLMPSAGPGRLRPCPPRGGGRRPTWRSTACRRTWPRRSGPTAIVTIAEHRQAVEGVGRRCPGQGATWLQNRGPAESAARSSPRFRLLSLHHICTACQDVCMLPFPTTRAHPTPPCTFSTRANSHQQTGPSPDTRSSFQTPTRTKIL